jgi:putative peptidoglycan lipid II flippase
LRSDQSIDGRKKEKSAPGKIAKAAGLLFVLQVVAQCTGLLKQMVVAAWFGTSATMDSYIVATSIVGLILLWIGLPVHQTLMPMFRHDLAQRGEQAAWKNFSILINTLLLVMIAIVAVGESITPFLVDALAPGFQEDTEVLTSSLTRITMISVVFVGLAAVLSQVCYSYERFFGPGLTKTVDNLAVMLVLLLLGSSYGIYGLAAGVVIGAVFRCIFLAPIVWEKRHLYDFKIDLRHPQFREMSKLSLPLLISTGGNELARVTDRIFASLLSVGSLSALAFAHRPTSVVFEFLVQPLQQAAFPHFTKLSAKKDFGTLSRQLFQYLRVVFFFTLPIGIGMMLTAEPLVRTLYKRGAFDETAVALTSQAVFFYAIGVPAHGITRLFRSTFFGLKDTWTPTKIALGCTGFKILLAWILIGPLAHAGIAMAESVSQIVNALLLFSFLPKEVKGEEGWKTVISFAQSLTSGAIMGAVVYFARETTHLSSPFLELAGLVLIGGAVYAVIGLVSQGEASQTVLKALSQFGGKFLAPVVKR